MEDLEAVENRKSLLISSKANFYKAFIYKLFKPTVYKRAKEIRLWRQTLIIFYEWASYVISTPFINSTEVFPKGDFKTTESYKMIFMKFDNDGNTNS